MKQDINDKRSRCKKSQVVTMGALLVDELGRTEKLPTENEEIFLDQLEIKPGGSAANTAVACSRLNLATGFIGAIGNDREGDFLLEDLKKENVDTSQLMKRMDAPTGKCIIITDRKESRHMYAFTGAGNRIDIDEKDTEYILNADILHIADLINVDPLIRAAEIASTTRSTQVALNPGGLIIGLGYSRIQRLLSLTNIYISSLEEAEKLYTMKDREAMVQSLFNEGIETVALTMGKQGCFIANPAEAHMISAFDVKEVVDTTGAGDAFSAGFLYGILNRYDLKTCGYCGNAVAALCIQEFGARNGVPTEEELKNYLRTRGIVIK